jgi:tetratricopeptide (TPR) repeat protein
MRWGNMELAEGDLDHAVRMDPYDEESRLNLARMQALTGNKAGAIELLEPLVEEGEDPDFVAPGALLRSQLSLALGTVDAALEDAEYVVELLPDRPWGYLQAAACHISKGIDGGKVIELLKTAESKVPSERDLTDLYALRAAAYEILGKDDKAAELRGEAEGVARLPGFVYGPLNPAGNIPINPNKPIDIRALLDDLFGEASNAPDGYENMLRQIVDRIPELARENPGVGQMRIELPEAPGMIGGKRQLVVSLAQRQQQQQA